MKKRRLVLNKVTLRDLDETSLGRIEAAGTTPDTDIESCIPTDCITSCYTDWYTCEDTDEPSEAYSGCYANCTNKYGTCTCPPSEAMTQCC